MTGGRGLNLAHKVEMWLQQAADSPGGPSKAQVVLWWIILALMIAISLINFDAYQLGTHFDDSRYVILARSLQSADRYGMINHPESPVPERYPFGYPLLLAPFLILFPNNLGVLKVLSLIATILNFALLFFGWRWFCKHQSYWWGLAFASLYAFSPMVIDHTHRVMSEPVFTTFCLLAILLAERYASGLRSRGWTTWMSLVLTFSVYTRTIGIVLVAWIFIYMLLLMGRKFWVQILAILAQMAILLAVIVWLTPVQWNDLLPLEYLKDENARALVLPVEASTPGLPPVDPATGDVNPLPTAGWKERLNSFGDILTFGFTQHFGRDIRSVALSLGGGEKEQAFADSIGFPALPLVIGYTISTLVLLGVIRLLARKGTSQFLPFAIAYFGAIFLWYWNDPRLLYPIQVQIYLGFFAGLEWVFTKLNGFFNRKVGFFNPSLVLPILVVISIVISAYKSASIQDSRLHAGDLRARTEWLRANTTPADIIMTEAPETDYLYADRKTLTQPRSLVRTAEDLERYLRENHVAYVLIAPDIKWMSSYIAEYSPETSRLVLLLESLVLQDRIRLAYSSDRDLIKVFRVLP